MRGNSCGCAGQERACSVSVRNPRGLRVLRGLRGTQRLRGRGGLQRSSGLWGMRGTPGEAPLNSAIIAALQAALATEHAAVYGYGIAGAHLSGHRQDAATRAWTAHRARRDQLIAMLDARGAQPVAAADAYQLPADVTTARRAAWLATAIENGVTRAYLGLVALPDPSLRTYGAFAMQDSAVRAAGWQHATAEFPGLPHSAMTRQPARTPRPGNS